MTKAAATVAATRFFAGSPDELRNVRSFVAEVIEGCPVAEDTVLLTCELATNAIVHTRSGKDGTFLVRVCADEGSARVEVYDLGSDKPPVVHGSVITAEAGRGLRLVEMIATRWGHSGGRSGRVVWFEMEWE